MDSRMQQRLDDLEQQADRLAFENETLRRRVEALEVQLDVELGAVAGVVDQLARRAGLPGFETGELIEWAKRVEEATQSGA